MSTSDPGRASGSGWSSRVPRSRARSRPTNCPPGCARAGGFSGSLMRSRCSPRATSSWYSTREPSGSSSTTYHRSVPRSRRSGSCSGSPKIRWTRSTASASPRYRNVQRAPSTIGTSCRARNRSTAAGVQRPALPEPVDRELAADRRPADGGQAASSDRSRDRPRPGPGCRAGSAPSLSVVDPGAVLQQDAAGRGEPPGEDRHPGRVVEQQPARARAAAAPRRGARLSPLP